MKSSNMWDNLRAQSDASSGLKPDTTNLHWRDAMAAEEKYKEIRDEEIKREIDRELRSIDSDKNTLGTFENSVGYSNPGTIVIGYKMIAWIMALATMGIALWYLYSLFTNRPGRSDAATYIRSRFDNESDGNAPAGQVNIADQILIYPSNDQNAVAAFKYGLSEDSIQWFLRKSSFENAPTSTNWSGHTMVFLKNIPKQWIKMNQGKKIVKEGWFLTFEFYNFRAVDSTTYRNIRAANF